MTIETPTDTQDSRGSVIQTWATFATVQGGFLDKSGREFQSAQQRYAEVTDVVQVRYVAGVTPKMRLNFNGRLLNIVAPLNIDERNREMQLVCREEV